MTREGVGFEVVACGKATYNYAHKGTNLREEQDAFNAQLDSLLGKHEGEFVLFKGGKPVEFFRDKSAAYGAGLERFGLDSTFLIAPVVKPSRVPVSVSWEAGVMFG